MEKYFLLYILGMRLIFRCDLYSSKYGTQPTSFVMKAACHLVTFPVEIPMAAEREDCIEIRMRNVLLAVPIKQFF